MTWTCVVLELAGVKRTSMVVTMMSGDEVGVMKVTRFNIEERVDPDGRDGAVLDGEDGALFIVRDVGIEELRVPVLAGPGAFAFWAEERSGFGVGQAHDEIEGGLSAEELGRGLAECGGAERSRGRK